MQLPAPPAPVEYLLCDEAMSSRFGAALGALLRPGDAVLLEGPLGAGKSHVARAAIRAIVGAETEVPSPTFTLVQTYDGPLCEVWHADLYRLTSQDEVLELGLLDAMQDAILLVEWPDRLGPYRPAQAITLRLQPEGESRRALVHGMSEAQTQALAGAIR